MDETCRETASRLHAEGRLADCFQHLYGFANEGDLEAMAFLASLMVVGLHKFENVTEFEKWSKSVSDAQREKFYADIQADVQLAVTWLRRASEAGMWGATRNLASYYFGVGDKDSHSEYCRLVALAKKQFDGQSA